MGDALWRRMAQQQRPSIKLQRRALPGLFHGQTIPPASKTGNCKATTENAKIAEKQWGHDLPASFDV
jgi:hypothetical protein